MNFSVQKVSSYGGRGWRGMFFKKKITKGDLHIEELFLKQKIYPDGRIMG